MTPSQTPKDILKEITKKKDKLWKQYPNFTNLQEFELIEEIHQLQLKFIEVNIDEKWKQKIKEEIENLEKREIRFVDNICKKMTLEELKTSLLKDETEKEK